MSCYSFNRLFFFSDQCQYGCRNALAEGGKCRTPVRIGKTSCYELLGFNTNQYERSTNVLRMSIQRRINTIVWFKSKHSRWFLAIPLNCDECPRVDTNPTRLLYAPNTNHKELGRISFNQVFAVNRDSDSRKCDCNFLIRLSERHSESTNPLQNKIQYPRMCKYLRFHCSDYA